MYKTATRRHTSHSNNYNLYADLEKIKSAFADTAADVRGKTGEIFIQSVDGIKENATQLRDNVADFTSERPFKSLGVAVLIGLAVGYLIKTRR